MAAHHGRDQWQKLTLAAEKDGTVTGLVELLADLGSHVAGGRRRSGAFMFNSIYKFPPTSSASRRCSPTRPGPTPTAPGAPRRRTPSNG